MLFKMRRNHSRESYLELVEKIRSTIPNVALSSDFIVGFCGETEEQFMQTMSLMEMVKYDQAYLFAYSMRERTHAHRRMQDDVPEDVKLKRLQKLIELFKRTQLEKQREEVGRQHLLMLDKKGRHEGQLSGLTDTAKRGIIQVQEDSQFKIGDFVLAEVTDVSQNTLFCNPIRTMGVQEYH